MKPNKGEIWIGTYKYVESTPIDIHDVEIISNDGSIVTFKRLDNNKMSSDFIVSFIDWFKLK
jgi:hypothetical protein